MGGLGATNWSHRNSYEGYLREAGYVAQQVFTCGETGLYWKKLPNRSYISQEEKVLPGHKPMKDRLTLLLCANASGDLKIKPLLVYHTYTPRTFRVHTVNRFRLPVMWEANDNALLTRDLFREWLVVQFAPTVKKYLADNNLPKRCLLLMDDAPAHPPSLRDRLTSEYDFIKFMFLTRNAPLLHPMDLQVIDRFKLLYTKALFARCFHVTGETSLTLREFWTKHVNILHGIRFIGKAWEEVTQRTLNSAWRNLWPECVEEREPEAADAEVMEHIVSMGKSMGLNITEEDIEELMEDHKEELTREELAELKSEQYRAFCEEWEEVEEEVREVARSEEIKSMINKWNDCQDFFEKHHPNVTVTNRVMDQMNDVVVSHFRSVLQRRKKQETVERSFARRKPAAKSLKKGGNP